MAAHPAARQALRFGTVQNLWPMLGFFSMVSGAGVAAVGLGMAGSPLAAVIGGGLAAVGALALMVRRGTIVDPDRREVTLKAGWRFLPENECLPFSAFTKIRVARSPGTTPIWSVCLSGDRDVFLPVGGRGRKKDAVRRAREIAELMGLEIAGETQILRPLEMA